MAALAGEQELGQQTEQAALLQPQYHGHQTKEETEHPKIYIAGIAGSRRARLPWTAVVSTAPIQSTASRLQNFLTLLHAFPRLK